MARLLLRAHRLGIVLTIVFSGFDVLVNTAAFAQVAGTTEAARRAFAASVQPLAAQLSYLLPLPHHLDTVGGYAEWRAYPIIAMWFVAWGLIVATGLSRGDEEKGVLEMYLATGVGRLRWLVVRSVGFALALAVAIAVTQLCAAGGIALAKATVSIPDLLGLGVALWGIGLAAFGISLALAQLVASRGTAAGLSTVVFVALFFLNSLSRTETSWRGVAHVSPFFLFDQTDTLAPGGTFDWVGTGVLVAVSVAGTALAVLAFSARDLGAPIVGVRARERRARYDATRNPLLRVPVASALWEQRWALVCWTVGAFVLGLFIAGVAQSASNLIESTPALRVWLQPGVSAFRSMISITWFTLLAFAVAAFAVVQTARWSGQDGSGRLEMMLAQPVGRWRIVVQRSLELGIASLLIVVVGTLGVLVGSVKLNLSVGDRIWLATLLLLPVALAFGAIGAAISSWLPRVAVGVVAALAIAAFFIQVFGPILRWPHWVLNLSLFQLYGTPMTSPIFWNGFWTLIAITVIGFGVAIAAMSRRAVGS